MEKVTQPPDIITMIGPKKIAKLPENKVLYHIQGKNTYGRRTQPPDIIHMVKLGQIV